MKLCKNCKYYVKGQESSGYYYGTSDRCSHPFYLEKVRGLATIACVEARHPAFGWISSGTCGPDGLLYHPMWTDAPPKLTLLEKVKLYFRKKKYRG